MLMETILSLGSNHDRARNINMAKEMLKDIFYAIRFSDTILTDPIGMPEGTPSYVNAVAVGMTSLSIDELRNEIKRIERLIGRDEFDMQRGKIHIDIDIMQYGEEKYKPNDWTREYNIRLLSQIIKG